MGPRFGIRALNDGDRCTLLLTGEMDLATVPQLEAAVARQCERGATQLVLDLTQLEFIDASGLHALVFAREQCQQRQCEFCLIPGRAQLQRLFKISGLIDRLPFREPDPEQPGEHAERRL
jgi:anti-sigma B factor antagonist